MATTSVGFYPPAEAVRSFASIGGVGHELALQVAIGGAIGAAAVLTLFTCTVDTTGYTNDDINGAMNILNGLGYQVSFSGNTLTLKW